MWTFILNWETNRCSHDTTHLEYETMDEWVERWLSQKLQNEYLWQVLNNVVHIRTIWFMAKVARI